MQLCPSPTGGCQAFRGEPAAEREGDTGRVGGAGTLDDLGDPVNPTLGGEGRAGSLDAQPGALEFGPG